ncbi:RabGAP/TBC [Nemania sp. FL0916]|nr:RabGAP/TBC [Nemania sp. FL0916]
MSTLEEPNSGPPPRLDESPSVSDKETDTFEDAVDTGSVRSLTNRKTSQPKSPLPADINADHTFAAPEDSADTDKPSGHAAAEAIEAPGEQNGTVATDSARTSKRLSHATLDNVDLDDSPPDTEQKETETETEAEAQTVPEPQKQPTKKLSLSNITSSLPSMPWSPSNADPVSRTSPIAPVPNAAPPPPPPPARKITSPFAWLSRNSGHKDIPPPQPLVSASSPRRNTASSIATLTSNPEMMLSKLEEEGSSMGANGGIHPSRNSLRDRFKMVRLREEAGISLNTVGDEPSSDAVASLVPRPTTASIVNSSIEVSESGNPQPPASPLPSAADANLAPGTVSGVLAGPSAMADAPVDWDLWQSVVYEGPAAVARTSPEELNRAIATGIPSAIRGVVWQVLAQSKNEDLELVYKELQCRGAEKEKDRHSNSTAASVTSGSNLGTEREPAASSASSTKSGHSGGSGKRLPGTPPEPSEAVTKAQALAAAEKKKKEKEGAVALQKLEKTIRRDLGARTSFSKYAAAAGLQEGLFGVCKAYALFDEGVGYAQGMNFLIMPLLFNMPEEEAFCLLVRLMNQYKLRDLFVQDMPGLHMHLYQFERILEDLEPALYCHLHRRGISPHLYATQWFLTLFAYRFPLQLVLRIYDLILSEGLSAILRFGIVLMQKNAATLLGMSDMSQLTTFLKDKLFDVYIDQSPSAGSILENGFFGSSSSNLDKEVYRADQLVRDACEIKLTPELLGAYASEWEEKTRAEKEREQELEQLRAANVGLAIKVRKLEERIEVSDREQADMANDLIHTKVENEELKDKNESLTGQVKELRIVIEKQPEEIEQAWKPERDDLIRRNEKVHQENERLEKELSELEEQLVKTKMEYAETNSQHETLKQKWQELKRQFA